MSSSISNLSAFDLFIGAFLILLSAVLSAAIDARLARSVVFAALRATVQLLLVGFVLSFVFELNSPLGVLGILFLMLVLACREVYSRQSKRIAGFFGIALVGFSTTVCTIFATFFALLAIGHSPWWSAQVVIPLMGIVIGSVMNGVGISLSSLFGYVDANARVIEARLALGHGVRQAFHEASRAALQTASISSINQMSAAGIITLPGMMTGQILAGMPVLQAAKYQILVLFVLCGGAILGSLIASFGAIYFLTDERQRLRPERISSVGG